ncbi:Uncharacterised protein [Vibrio cholerae]|nr:Uncharacterised protein [Vibrio cholerae]
MRFSPPVKRCWRIMLLWRCVGTIYRHRYRRNTQKRICVSHCG